MDSEMETITHAMQLVYMIGGEIVLFEIEYNFSSDIFYLYISI